MSKKSVIDVLLLLIIRIKNVLFLVMIKISQRQYRLLLIVNKINNLKDVLFEYTQNSSIEFTFYQGGPAAKLRFRTIFVEKV